MTQACTVQQQIYITHQQGRRQDFESTGAKIFFTNKIFFNLINSVFFALFPLKIWWRGRASANDDQEGRRKPIFDAGT